MNSSLKRQLLKTFAQMIDDLNGPGEVEKFLVDFFDNEELEKYVKRMMIAYWLRKGRTIVNIKENLKASASEIKTAEKLIKTEGVKLALKKIEAEEWANQWTEKIQKIVKK